MEWKEDGTHQSLSDEEEGGGMEWKEDGTHQSLSQRRKRPQSPFTLSSASCLCCFFVSKQKANEKIMRSPLEVLHIL